MDQVTQQNAALVEQAAAAAESMQDQAASLTQTVSVFKLDGGQFMVRHSPQTTSTTTVRQAKPAPAANRGEQKLRLAAQDARPARPALAANGNADDWEEF
jgi:methyl-accepting chemotaxis protein